MIGREEKGGEGRRREEKGEGRRGGRREEKGGGEGGEGRREEKGGGEGECRSEQYYSVWHVKCMYISAPYSTVQGHDST